MIRSVIAGLAFLSTVFCLAQDNADERMLTLDDPRVNESSGLALSLISPGILWTHNDSGGGAYLFALDEKGSVRGRFNVKGAFNFDWEDMASGLGEGGRAILYIGDIGDNLGIRNDVQIYRVEEPLVDVKSNEVVEREITESFAFRASYPDGRHNAESLLCHPRTGQLFIITKRDDGQCGVYAFPLVLASDSVMTLERVGVLRLPELTKKGKRPIDNRLSTAACFSPDAQHLVVMSYSSLYEWKLGEGQAFGAALELKPRQLEIPLMPQGEAVCYSRDGTHFWCTSERLPARLYRIPR